MTTPTFGGNLKRLRERAGFTTARALANKLGVVPSMVSKWERDRQGLPEGPTLLRLAKTIHCAIDELLVGVDADYDAILGRTKSGTAVVPAAGYPIDGPLAKELSELWPRLDDPKRRAVLGVVRTMLGVSERRGASARRK